MTRSRAGRLGFLAFLAVLSATAVSASPHQLFLDFDTDGDLWTINPHAAGVPVSLIVQIGDDPISPGAGAFLYFELGCYFDPQSMEGRNCAMIDCDPAWCAPGVLSDCWVDCPPLADCWDAILMGVLDPGFPPQPGERYRIGTLGIGQVGDEACDGSSYSAFGDFAGNEVHSNYIWMENPASAPETDEPGDTSPTWGEVKARFREPR
jgi:hypothetical protein